MPLTPPSVKPSIPPGVTPGERRLSWRQLLDRPASLVAAGIALLATDLPIHHTRHEAGGADAMAIDAGAATGSLRTLGTGAAQAAAGNHTHDSTTLTGRRQNHQFSIGTIASLGNAVQTIVAARASKNVYFEGYFSGFENQNSGSWILRFRGTIRWDASSTVSAWGVGELTAAEFGEAESLGANDWRTAAYATVAGQLSGQDLQIKLTNTSAANITGIQLFIETFEADT